MTQSLHGEQTPQCSIAMSQGNIYSLHALVVTKERERQTSVTSLQSGPAALYGPTVGALNAESSPPQKTSKKKKVSWSRNTYFVLRICTILCMRDAVAISSVSRILPSPLGPLNALKTKIRRGIFPTFVFHLFWEPLGLWFLGATVGPSL